MFYLLIISFLVYFFFFCYVFVCVCEGVILIKQNRNHVVGFNFIDQ